MADRVAAGGRPGPADCRTVRPPGRRQRHLLRPAGPVVRRAGELHRRRRSRAGHGEFHDIEAARDRNVLVVGYGKSSCDVAVPVSEVAAQTHVVARGLLWKMPRSSAVRSTTSTCCSPGWVRRCSATST
ncbi:hypothetical protein NKG94_06005 [Micromonospora sp. M12]